MLWPLPACRQARHQWNRGVYYVCSLLYIQQQPLMITALCLACTGCKLSSPLLLPLQITLFLQASALPATPRCACMNECAVYVARVLAKCSQAIPLSVAWMVWYVFFYVFLMVVCSVAVQQPGYTHWCPLHSPWAWGGIHLIQLCSGGILQCGLLVALPDCYTLWEGGTGACSREDGEGGKGMVRVVHRAPQCMSAMKWYVYFASV